MPSAKASAWPERCIVTPSGSSPSAILRASSMASPSGRPSRLPEIVTLRCRSTRVIAEGAALFSTFTRLRSSTTSPVRVRTNSRSIVAGSRRSFSSRRTRMS